MNITPKASPIVHFVSGMIMLVVVLLASCQQQTGQETEATEQQTVAVAQATADTIPNRGAPAFYLVPPQQVRQRVWICDAATTDIFHVKADCPELLACKGKGSFRNVSLLRAIEDYGRYNCQACSKDMDHIFDEDLVR